MYVVMWMDRHTDPLPLLFTDRDAAIARARQIVQEYVDEGRAIYGPNEEQPGPGDWLYYATWNHEGDAVYVIERPVDAGDV